LCYVLMDPQKNQTSSTVPVEYYVPQYHVQQNQQNTIPYPQNPVYVVANYNMPPNGPPMYFQHVQQPMPPQVMAPPTQVVVMPPAPTTRVEEPTTKLGHFSKFFSSLFLCMFFPFLSLFIVFAFETTMLTKLGAIFAHFNMVLWVAFYMISLGSFIDMTDSWNNCNYDTINNNYNYNSTYNQPNYACSSSNSDNSGIYAISAPFFFISILLGIWAGLLFKKYLRLYKVADPKERAAPLANIGRGSDFTAGFLMSFFLPVLGSGIIICVNKSVKCRYGSVVGLASMFLAFGVASSAFWFLGFITGNPCLWVGLMMLECAIIHFERIIVSSEVSGGYIFQS